MIKTISLFLAIAMVLSACTISFPILPTENSKPSSIEQAVKNYLSKELGVSIDQLELISIEAVEWGDSCLGIKSPDPCLTVVTPGYKVIIKADGKTYELHTNKNASRILIVKPDDEPQIVKLVKADLAAKLSINESEITTVLVEEVEWPDSCLGVHEEGVMCMTVITPGYRIILKANNKTYTYHTDLDGKAIIHVTKGDEPEIVMITKKYMASQFNFEISEINLVEYEKIQWPDGCLGISEPDVMCTQAIVPGYRVILEKGGETYSFRTDESGQMIKLEPVTSSDSNKS